MANEFERINNPDLTPGAVSTGYQLQNTNIVSIRVGEDKSVVLGGTGQCTLEISGPVDVNGEIYTCNSQVIFTLATAGKYYIHLSGSGANLTPTIGTGANTFDADKNARYTDTGTYRVLNWVIYYDGTTAYVHRLTNPVNDMNDYGDVGSPEEYWITSDGVWVAKRSKYYTMYVTGHGGSGGSGGNGWSDTPSAVATRGTISGKAGSTGIKRIFVTAGDIWTATFSTGVGSTTFANGVSTLVAGNQGGAVTGCDKTFLGGGASYGGNGGSEISNGENGISGASSFWGDGGDAGIGGLLSMVGTGGNGGGGGNGISYGSGGGSGGGGGGTKNSSVSSGGSGGGGGTGASGVIRIIG